MAMAISYVTQQPQRYALNNETAVSDVFSKAMEQVSGENGIRGVEPASPVQYTNATKTSNSLEATKKLNQQYNEIASAYEGVSTSYSADMQQQAYAVIGNSVDLYA